MEEIVALDSSKQKQLVKSIKGIKKKLTKKNQTPESENVVAENKDEKTNKRKIKERGLVYLGHIPHGFYENEMTQYFKQFGMVTNVRVIRSKRTGNSKGYAFIEFKEPTVAQIVADTMNNYLMGKRLLKASYIPPEKQKKHALRKKWNPMHNPSRDDRIKQKKAYNAEKSNVQHLKMARKTLSNINKTKVKLRELGIDYDFFTPVDVPEALLSSVKANANDKTEKPKKLSSKSKVVETAVQTKKGKQEKDVIKKDNKSNVKEPPKTAAKNEKINTADAKNKKVKQESKGDIKQQKQKEQKLKEKGVKPAQNFINAQEESADESDSSLAFDSDEYEKLMDDEDDSLGSEEEASDSDDGSEDEDSNDEESGEDSQEEVVPKMPLVLNPNKLKKQEKKKDNRPQPQAKRRAIPAVPAVASPPKKPKFEKQQKNPQFAKKQFKKKK